MAMTGPKLSFSTARVLLASTAVFIMLSAIEARQCYWCGPLAEQVHRSRRAPECNAGSRHVTVCEPGFTHCAIVATSPPQVESRHCVKLYQDECYPVFCNSTKTWKMTCPCRGELCNGPNTERELEAFAALSKLVAKTNLRIKKRTATPLNFIKQTKVKIVNPDVEPELGANSVEDQETIHNNSEEMAKEMESREIENKSVDQEQITEINMKDNYLPATKIPENSEFQTIDMLEIDIQKPSIISKKDTVQEADLTDTSLTTPNEDIIQDIEIESLSARKENENSEENIVLQTTSPIKHLVTEVLPKTDLMENKEPANAANDNFALEIKSSLPPTEDPHPTSPAISAPAIPNTPTPSTPKNTELTTKSAETLKKNKNSAARLTTNNLIILNCFLIISFNLLY